LFIARQIVLAHHGEIWAVSPGTGKGSTFFVRISSTSGHSLAGRHPPDQGA
jgi:signal transduction histidine kinase